MTFTCNGLLQTALEHLIGCVCKEPIQSKLHSVEILSLYSTATQNHSHWGFAFGNTPNTRPSCCQYQHVRILKSTYSNYTWLAGVGAGIGHYWLSYWVVSGPQGLLDTNILVYVTQREGFHIAVEYRLHSKFKGQKSFKKHKKAGKIGICDLLMFIQWSTWLWPGPANICMG